jgi:Transposase IS66 family
MISLAKYVKTFSKIYEDLHETRASFGRSIPLPLLMPRIFFPGGKRPVPPKLPDSMPWQIYQAYLRGPSALLRLFEDAFGRQALYGPPDPDMQQREIDALSEHIGQLKAQIEKLQAEVSQLHHHISAGTVANTVRECADTLVETELKIKRGLRRSSVIHSDETGLRINKRLGYVHVASTAHLTHYGAANHRGQTAMDEINVLPRYRGTCVHDGLLAYKHYTQCRHALCGVHLLRDRRSTARAVGSR